MYRNSFSKKPGLNINAMTEVDRIMKSHRQLVAYITMDEMKIRENLLIRDGKLIGFVDYGDVGNQSNPIIASHILVFYLRSLYHEISIPVAWYPTKSTAAVTLSQLFWNLLWECESRNVQIHAVICDGCSANRTFFKLVCLSKFSPGNPYVAPNPYATERPIFLCSDPSHLLKTTRNSLLSSKPGGVRFMCKNKQNLLWSHIQDLYKKEQQTLLLSRCRLTEAHMKPNPYSKMKVSLARDILSWKVGKCLHLIDGAMGTAKFVLLFARKK
ncbi:uncharacterized protein LOC108950638 [Ciona intestinalis]